MKIITEFEQRSPEWFAIRKGKITMSGAKALLTKGKGVTRSTYLQSVAAEILADTSGDSYQSMDMLRGVELEPFAIQAYEAYTGHKVHSVGFVLADDERIGCSPDGITQGKALEIKCTLPKNHLRYLDKKQVEIDHGAQMLGEMWVCETGHVDFVSFCPWVKSRPLIVHTFDRDEATIKALADSAISGADEVEQIVKSITEQAIANNQLAHIASEAARYWDSYAEVQSAEVDLSE